MLAQVRGGVETMSLRYHEAMRQAGYTVVSAGHSEGVLALSLPRDEFRPMDALTNHDPFVALKLRKLVREFQPDLVLTHGNRATGICLLPFVGTAGKTVQVAHNFRHKSQIGRVRAAICVSSSVHDSLAAAWPCVPLYDVANFGPLNLSPVKPAPAGTPVIGTLGRLHVNKGLDIIVKAMVRLKHDGVPMQLKIAGEGPLKTELERLIDELELRGVVEFCGWVQPRDYLHGLDLFILPSRVEPFGLVVTEAMAAGVPVVATRIDGPREILCEGEYGLLAANEDPLALAEAIKVAIGDWPATLDRARRAQVHAMAEYSPEAGQARLTRVLEQIAAKTS